MATLLDDELERHDGPEPRVLTEDVQAVLRHRVRPGGAQEDSNGDPVALIAARARVSSRTVYRVLNPGEAKKTISLDLADRLAVAAESHLGMCRLVWPNTQITSYDTLPGNLG
jgi:hypothetical protein